MPSIEFADHLKYTQNPRYYNILLLEWLKRYSRAPQKGTELSLFLILECRSGEETTRAALLFLSFFNTPCSLFIRNGVSRPVVNRGAPASKARGRVDEQWGRPSVRSACDVFYDAAAVLPIAQGAQGPRPPSPAGQQQPSYVNLNVVGRWKPGRARGRRETRGDCICGR